MRILLRDLSPGTQYAIQLRSQDANGNTSAWSRIFYLTTSADTIAPNVPTGLAVASNGSTFVATWNAVTQSSDGTPAHDLAGYLVQVDSPLGAGTRTYKTVDTRFEFPYESNVSVFGTPRATVRFAVAAIDSTGNTSAYSTQVSATNPPPANPTGLTADPVMDGISLKWNAVADTDLVGYRVYHGTTAGSQTTLAWSGNATNATIANFAYSTDAYYRVVAVDVFGSESSSGPVTGAVRPKSSFAVDTTAPAAVTGLTATLTVAADASSESAAVSWTAVADSDLAGYVVGYRPVGATDWQYDNIDKSITSTRIDRLIAYANYEFRIRSYDWSANYSAWSSTVTATAPANSAPSTPAAPTASSGTQRIQVTITGNKAAGGAMEGDVAYYEVYASNTTGFTPAAANMLGQIAVGPAMVDSWQVPASSASGTTENWYVKIIAVDRGGLKSAASAQATATPNLILTANIGDAQITNAKIGSVAADKLTAGLGFINDLTVKSKFTLGDATTDGIIESYDYGTSGGTAGFRMAKSGLIIKTGSIEAAALKIQSGTNNMPAEYAGFEYTSSFYSGKLSAGSMIWGISNGTGKFGPQYLATVWGAASTNPIIRLAANPTDYNTPFEGGKTYIISAYTRVQGSVATTVRLGVKMDNGVETLNLASVSPPASTATWVRFSAEYTVPAGVAKGHVLFDSTTLSANGGFDIDGVQVEEKIGSSSTPSSWTMPGVTTADGGLIRTGQLQSTSTIAVGGTTQPAWSINLSGNAQFGDALVRGKLIVGTGNETLPNVAPAGGNFETTDISKYAIYSSGATTPAIARTTTAGEVITGTGSLKVSAAAGSKTALGVTVTNPKTYVAGTTVTVKARFKTDAAGGTVSVTFWDSATTSNATQTVNVMSNPAANTVYYIEASYTIPPGVDNAFFSIYQAGTITTTSFIVDDISLQANDTLGESFIASGNFISGEGGTGWRIDGQGNAEINNGIFRGQLGARVVTADSIASVITMSSIFRTGISGKRIEFSSDGFAMYDSDETQIIYLPTDPLLPSSFAGDVLASSLTISDQLAIRGSVNELSKGATLTIASGTTAPSSPATVTVDWDNYDGKIGGAFTSFEPYRYGFAYTSHFGGKFVTVQNVYGGTPYLDYFNTGGGRSLQSNEVDFTDASGGVTSIGSVVYVLGKVSNGDWYVKGYDTSGVEMSSWKYPHNATLHRKPAIGTDGTNIVVTFCGSIASGSGHVQWRVFNKTTGAQIGSTVGAAGLVLGADMSSVNIGTFDMGTTRVVVTAYAYNTAYVLDTAGNRVSTYDFPTASKPYGMCWANKGDGISSFYSFDAPGNRFYRYSGATWTAAGDESWTVANTWYDSNATGGTHETNLGPQRTFTMKKRARVTITAPPLPLRPTPTTTDDAVAVGVYMARGAVSSGTVLAVSRFERQGYLPDGVRSKTYHTEGGSLTTLPAAGANGTNQPPFVSNFASSAPGLLTSSNSIFQLYGDGSGQWGGLSVDPAGTAVLSGNVAAPAYVNIGSTTETTSRLLRIFKKATAGTNYYESRQYLYDGGTTSGWANVIFENGAESARVQFNPVDGRMSLRNTTANVTRYVPIVDAGTAAINAIAAGGAQTISVTFNTGRFTATPILTAVSDSARHTIACTARSTTGATFVINNWSGANAAAGTLQWIAVQE